MKTLEEITYEAGRAALAEQESVVAGIRQRTGTLLAAHALVASFLGGASIRDGIDPWAFAALGVLVAGLVVAAILLAPWRVRFAVDARDLYEELYPYAAAEPETEAMGWLARAGIGYQGLHDENAARVHAMSRLSGTLAALVVVETLCWLLALPLES